MKSSKLFLLMIAIVLCSLVLPTASSKAQPTLSIKRLVKNWPTIELYLTVVCDSKPVYTMSAQNFAVMENGMQMNGLTLTCPTTNTRCYESIALVFDCSFSMQGSPLSSAMNFGLNFVTQMDGVHDEACIVSFADTAALEQSMTTNKSLLNAAISGLNIDTLTALWDGFYLGLQHIASNSTNPCRAMIVITDGSDNVSVHTPSEIIALAREAGVVIFTISINSASVGDLMNIAGSTGGKYYNTTASGLNQVMSDISQIVFNTIQECKLTYQTSCKDGTQRNVTLLLNNTCSGSDTDTASYIAPKDIYTFAPTRVSIDTVTAVRNTIATVPVRLLDLTSNYHPTGTVVIELEPAIGEVIGVETQGLLLEGVPITFSKTTNSTTFRFHAPTGIDSTGTLFNILVGVKSVLGNVETPIAITSWLWDYGCMRPVMQNGMLKIVGNSIPDITASGQLSFCEGETVTLTASSGFPKYQWSNGATSQSIVVTTTGTYTVTVTDQIGNTGRSLPTSVKVIPLPKPLITVIGKVRICSGGSVTLDAGPGWAGYHWCDGSISRYLTTGNAGVYWVVVQDTNGCWGPSDTVRVIVQTPAPVITPAGPIAICIGDSISLDAGAGFASYQWSTGENSQTIMVRSSGKFQCTVTDSYGCVAATNPVDVTVSTAARISIASTGSNPLCVGDTLILEAPNGYTDYLWSTGETTQRIDVTMAGVFWVTAHNQTGCVATSDTMNVTVVSRPTNPVIAASGPTTFCSGDSVVLDAGGGYLLYEWNTGEQTRSVLVKKNGTYTCKVGNMTGCTSTTPGVTVIVVPIPAPHIATTGSNPICMGDTVTLSADADYPSMFWSNGGTGRSIKVWNAGTFWLLATNADGCSGYSDTVVVTVNPLPAKPVITRTPGTNTLVSNTAAAGYQWMHNGTPIQGATSQTLTVSDTGRYTIRITDGNGCSATSDPFILDVLVGTDNVPVPGILAFDIHPEPNTGQPIVRLDMLRPCVVTMIITDALGRTVFESSEYVPQASYIKRLDLTSLPSGSYFIRASVPEGSIVKRMTVKK